MGKKNWFLQNDGEIVEADRATRPGVSIFSPMEGIAVLLLVERSPKHEDGDLLRARERIRQKAGYRHGKGFDRDPLFVASLLLQEDLRKAKPSGAPFLEDGALEEANVG